MPTFVETFKKTFELYRQILLNSTFWSQRYFVLFRLVHEQNISPLGYRAPQLDLTQP